MVMMASTVFQAGCYSPPQSAANYSSSSSSSSSLVKSTWSLVFPPKKPLNILHCCLERRRMQSIIDTSWSSPLLPSQISPWLMLAPELTKSYTTGYKFYSISDDKVMRFEGDGHPMALQFEVIGDGFRGSSHGWLAQLDSRTRDLFLYNPISRHRLKLPSMDTLPLRGSPAAAAVDFNDTDKLSECLVTKVILSSSDPDKDESCVAMMLYGSHNRLAFCHPAQGTRAKWFPLNSCSHWWWDDSGRKRQARSYGDIAYSAREKLFFCITKEGGSLEAWDSMALRDEDMPISIQGYDSFLGGGENNHYPWPHRCEREFYLKGRPGSRRERYLVVAEPCGGGGDGSLPSQQLLVVLRHKITLEDGELHTVAFDVHRFDVRTRKLVYMDRTLDGLALFVGKNHAFAVKASQFDRLKPNSIYFTDDDSSNIYPGDDYGGHDLGIYDYGNASFSSCYYPCEAHSIKKIHPAPMWFSPYQWS